MLQCIVGVFCIVYLCIELNLCEVLMDDVVNQFDVGWFDFVYVCLLFVLFGGLWIVMLQCDVFVVVVFVDLCYVVMVVVCVVDFVDVCFVVFE